MKKVISVLLAVLCVFSIFAINVSAINDPVISPESKLKIISGVRGDKKGGTITPKTSEYTPGDDVTFHIIPNKGYRIKQVWVNGVAIGPVEEYTFYNIQEDSTIYAEFEKIPEETTKSTPNPQTTTKQVTTKQNKHNVSPDTGIELTTVVYCVLTTLVIGSVAAIIVAKKSRKEEY